MSQNCECEKAAVTVPVRGLELKLDQEALAAICTGGGTSGDWQGELTENGWTKFPNGLILQWGTYNGTAKGAFTVPFNIPFTHYPFVAVATYFDANGYADIGISALNRDNMSVYVDTNKSGSTSFRWIALGI